MYIKTYEYEIKVIEYLASIKRFPPVQIWKTEDNRFKVECSPSFTLEEGTGGSLSLALQDLVNKLTNYLTNEEFNYLEDLRDLL